VWNESSSDSRSAQEFFPHIKAFFDPYVSISRRAMVIPCQFLAKAPHSIMAKTNRRLTVCPGRVRIGMHPETD